MALSRNSLGEYNYQFNWVDEDGRSTGFNDVWAPNKREAIKRVKKMEVKAHWALWDVKSKQYIRVDKEVKGEQHCFRMKGMYCDISSMYRANDEQRREMARLGNMMSM